MRGKLYVFTGAVLGLLTLMWFLGADLALARLTFTHRLAALQQQVSQMLDFQTRLRQDSTSLQGQTVQKQGELKTKQSELDKLSADIAAKLKELDATNKKIKAQQAQLSSESAELNDLKNRPVDRPPLFN